MPTHYTKVNGPNRGSTHLLWCDFTRKREPILARSAEAQPQRLRVLARARPTRKTLSLFLRPPAEFLFSCKGCFLVVRLLQAVEALGLRPGGIAAALRAHNLKV